MGLSGAFGGTHQDDYDVPGARAQVGIDQLRDHLPGAGNAGARVVVYPSHYEGFGLPVIDTLALGKPVVVLDSAVNRELASMLGDANFHRIGSMNDLRAIVEKLFRAEPAGQAIRKEPRRWRDAAQEYAQAFREMISRDFDLARMRARWELLRTLDSAALPEEDY